MSANKKLKLSELGRISESEFKSANKIPVSVILDDIRSMHNVGSFFRTSDAFRIDRIFLCGLTAKPPHREIEKTALGSTQSVDWEYNESVLDVIEKLKSEGVKICSVEQTENSVSLEKASLDHDSSYAIVFGNEVKGVHQEVINESDLTLEIPQFGTKHSLNVAVCGGIVLWHFFSFLNSENILD